MFLFIELMFLYVYVLGWMLCFIVVFLVGRLKVF